MKNGGKSKMMEYPLPNQNNPKLVGPARIIMHHEKDGSMKFVGVVSHDQSRLAGHDGVYDHFKIKKAEPKR